MNGDGAQRSGAQMIMTMIMTTISDVTTSRAMTSSLQWSRESHVIDRKNYIVGTSAVDR